MPVSAAAQARFDSTRAFVAQTARLDANESAFVARALLFVEAETYNTLLPPLEGRKFVPVDGSAHPGAKFTSYKQYTRTGVARLVTERGMDLPRSSLYVKEFFHQFYRLGMSYGYTLDDLLAAQFSGQNGGPALNIDLEEAIGCREGIEKALDRIAAFGSAASSVLALVGLGADVGMVGLLNNPNVTAYTIPVGASGSALWSAKTADEVLADLTGIVAAQVGSTYKVHTPDALICPITQLESIAGRSMGDGRSDTILSYFLKTNRHIKDVDSWQYLTGTGAGGTDQIVCYKRDKRMLRHMISQEFTQMPPQFENLEYLTDCTAKTAGVVIPYPLSISIGYGI
jgi:hypothetical protein